MMQLLIVLMIIIPVILVGGRRLKETIMFFVLLLHFFLLAVFNLDHSVPSVQAAKLTRPKTDTSNTHRRSFMYFFVLNSCTNILFDEWVVYSLTESVQV